MGVARRAVNIAWIAGAFGLGFWGVIQNHIRWSETCGMRT